jgi:hypothetical protein
VTLCVDDGGGSCGDMPGFSTGPQIGQKRNMVENEF